MAHGAKGAPRGFGGAAVQGQGVKAGSNRSSLCKGSGLGGAQLSRWVPPISGAASAGVLPDA